MAELRMYIEKIKSYKHQIDARRAARDKVGFAYLMEMGTGKSKAQIDEFCEMYENQDIDSVLILAPKGVYRNWDQIEIPTHTPDSILAGARVLAWNSGGERYRERLAAIRLRDKFSIFIVNIEALSSGTKGVDACESFLSSHESTMVVVDESTFIKNHAARRTKNVIKLGERAAYRRILTGSPVTRSPLDLYSQFAFLGRNILGFSSYYSFRARYAVMQRKHFGGRGVDIVVGYREMDDLTTRISPHSFRVKKDDCLDLPPKVYVQRDVEMTEEQARLYREFRENATVALADHESHVTATEVITQLLRLQQILCGHVRDELGVVHDVPSHRVSALLDLVGEVEGKAIVWCRYRKDIENVTEALRKEYGASSVATYYGDTSGTEREDSVYKFQGHRYIIKNGVRVGEMNCPEKEQARFFVGNPQTGGYGITLTAASTVVYYSNSYDLEQRMQSEDRAHRSGQTKSVLYVDLVCRGTVEERIVAALRKKIDIASAIMGDGYRAWLV